MTKAREYCEKFDVYYNPEDGKLLEQGCLNEDCEYCANRPDKITRDFCKGCRYEEDCY